MGVERQSHHPCSNTAISGLAASIGSGSVLALAVAEDRWPGNRSSVAGDHHIGLPCRRDGLHEPGPVGLGLQHGDDATGRAADGRCGCHDQSRGT
jgi:hypothetical protein